MKSKRDPRDLKFVPVAFDNDGKRYQGMVVSRGFFSSDGSPSTWVVGISMKSPKHKDGKTTTMTTAEVLAGHELWKADYAPTRIARLWSRLIAIESRNKKPNVGNLLTTLFPNHEPFPPETTANLVYAVGNAVTMNGRTSIFLNDDMEIWQRGEHDYIVVMSERNWADTREVAVLSKLFAQVCRWDKL